MNNPQFKEDVEKTYSKLKEYEDDFSSEKISYEKYRKDSYELLSRFCNRWDGTTEAQTGDYRKLKDIWWGLGKS